MNAILLSAGYGSRLRPLTLERPKCLIKIKNREILSIWINKLHKINVKKILVNTHYLHKKVENFINKQKYKDVTLSHEKELLGTAGTLINNINFYDGEDGLLIHADNYTNDDLDKFITFHKLNRGNALMTMFLFRTNDIKNCGIVELNKKKYISNYIEKPNHHNSNLANGAIYILTDKLINLIKSDFINASDFVNDIIPKISDRIICYETKEKFIDIGTLENLNKANLF